MRVPERPKPKAKRQAGVGDDRVKGTRGSSGHCPLPHVRESEGGDSGPVAVLLPLHWREVTWALRVHMSRRESSRGRESVSRELGCDLRVPSQVWWRVLVTP